MQHNPGHILPKQKVALEEGVKADEKYIYIYIFIHIYPVLYYVHLVTEVTTPIECPEIIWGLRMKGENYAKPLES